MVEKPSPPRTIPKYVRDGVEVQDESTLEDISDWAGKLAEWKENRELSEEDIDAEIVGKDVPDEWDEDEWEDLTDGLEAPAKLL